MSYNGWTNYETWAVKLWLDNDYNSYTYYQSLAKSRSYKSNATILLADALKESVENNAPLLGEASLYSDLLSSALSEVNWHEIAEAFLEEIKDA